MPRLLRLAGLMVLAAAIVLLLAGEAGAVSEEFVDLAFLPAIKAGAIAFSAGLALSLLAPLRRIRPGRCVRCGARIEKGQTYCHDHLRAAVQEFTDLNRRGA